MQAAQKGATRNFLDDICDRRMRVVRSRNIIKCQKYPGDRLGDEEKKKDRAKDIGPACAAWDGFIEGFVHQGVEAGPSIDPLISPLPKVGARLRNVICLIVVRHSRPQDKTSFVATSCRKY